MKDIRKWMYLYSVVNKASYTMFMGNRTARYKGEAMNGSTYSQSTDGATILTATPQTDSKMLKVSDIGKMSF